MYLILSESATFYRRVCVTFYWDMVLEFS